MIYLTLFAEFFKIGLFAVGGGLATLPFLQELSVRYDWFSASELADMVAVAESTPGPIGINMATYAGIKAAGVLGGIVATFGEVLPALIIMTLIVSLLSRFQENRFVTSVTGSLRPVSVGLICAAVWSLLKIALLDTSMLENSSSFTLSCVRLPTLALFAILLLTRLKWSKLHPILWIAVGAAAGILLGL